MLARAVLPAIHVQFLSLQALTILTEFVVKNLLDYVVGIAPVMLPDQSGAGEGVGQDTLRSASPGGDSAIPGRADRDGTPGAEAATRTGTGTGAGTEIDSAYRPYKEPKRTGHIVRRHRVREQCVARSSMKGPRVRARRKQEQTAAPRREWARCIYFRKT